KFPSCTTAAFDMRKTLSKTGSTSLRGIGPVEAKVTLPCTLGSTTKLIPSVSPSTVLATFWMSAPSKLSSTPSPPTIAAESAEATRKPAVGPPGLGPPGEEAGSAAEPGNSSGSEDWLELLI